MIRKVVTAVILVPLAAIIVAFAVANRQAITLSFDPFNQAQPAYAVSLQLWMPIFIALLCGVLLGGMAVWLKQTRWAWMAQRMEKENRDLRIELDRARHDLAVGSAPRLPYRAPAE